MSSIRYLAIIVAVILLGFSLTAGCSRKTPVFPDRNQENAGESHWSATYAAAGESMPMTLILVAGDPPERSRLVALSAFGATLGDCAVENGRGLCRPGAPPGVEKLMTRLSGAVGAMLERDPDFLAKPGRGPVRIVAQGWEAQRDAAGLIEYRPAVPANWTLVMKPVTTK